jgi:hypothetical protein
MSTRTRSASQQDSNTLWREKLVIGHDPDRSARCRSWVKRSSPESGHAGRATLGRFPFQIHSYASRSCRRQIEKSPLAQMRCHSPRFRLGSFGPVTVIAMSLTEIDRMSVLRDLAASKGHAAIRHRHPRGRQCVPSSVRGEVQCPLCQGAAATQKNHMLKVG